MQPLPPSEQLLPNSELPPPRYSAEGKPIWRRDEKGSIIRRQLVLDASGEPRVVPYNPPPMTTPQTQDPATVQAQGPVGTSQMNPLQQQQVATMQMQPQTGYGGVSQYGQYSQPYGNYGTQMGGGLGMSPYGSTGYGGGM